jgi:AIG2-like family
VAAPGWKLTFDKPARSGSAANIRPGVQTVWGRMYVLSPQQWRRLQQFEPGYQVISVAVQDTHGVEHTVQTFRYTGSVHTVRPSAKYIAHLVRGANAACLPLHYIKRFISLAVDAQMW